VIENLLKKRYSFRRTRLFLRIWLCQSFPYFQMYYSGGGYYTWICHQRHFICNYCAVV